MFRPGVGGIGNLFAQITQCEIVSDTIYKGGRDKYICFENIRVEKDDGTLPCKETTIHLSNPINYKISEIVKPTEYMKKLIDEYSHLVNGVSFAFQIRRCGLAKNFNELTLKNNYCTDETLNKFCKIMDSSHSYEHVFVTSDCYDTKQFFKKMWPDRVRILDEHSVHTSSEFDIDPKFPILEFFLLSMCPFIYFTGGDQYTGMTMSTYGFMAAVYGKKPYHPVFN